jgi:Cu+-exporting ATPase
MRKKSSVRIEGMHCATCGLTIEKSLRALSGVERADVSLASNSAVVEYDPQKVDFRAIAKAVGEAGYKVSTERTVIEVDDIRCASCIKAIEDELIKLDGVVSASVNLATKMVIVEHDPNITSANKLKAVIKDLGYTPHLKEEVIKGRKSSMGDFILALALSIPVFLLSMFGMGIPYRELILLLLTTPVQFVSGRHFYVGAFKSLKRGSPDMNVLVALGTSVAYFYSAYTTFFGGVVYFEAAALLITFVLFGRYLEDRAKVRASAAIRKLIELQPKFATIVRDEKELRIPVEEVAAGDLFVVKPGEVIAVDGRIIEGKSSIDESMVTGESIPVDRGDGEDVIGGTINQNGLLRIEALRVGKDTFLAQIIKFVEEAQARKAPIQRFADKIASYFVPTIIVIALLTFIAWTALGKPLDFSLLMAVSVLVIACPCALGLATPAAIMVGLGKGAELGILIKGGEILEAVRKLQTVVFDKTGTLTVGKPKVVEVSDFSGVGSDEILATAGALEQGSEHPLAKAVAEAAQESWEKREGRQSTPYQLSDFESYPGEGVKGRLGGETAILGNRKLFNRFGIDLSAHEARIGAMESQGKTTSILLRGKTVLGAIGITDTQKPHAKDAVSALKEEGLEVVMLTGDNERVARSVSESLGIQRFIAGVPPNEKALEIQKLQQGGKVVAMVGDGVNDAPAITQADVGIAIGSGTEIAKEAGGIILSREDLMDVVTAIDLSKKTYSKIVQNMFWALFYNAIGVPIAAGVLYPAVMLMPEFAALAMAFSSVSVVTNSLLLRRYSPRRG